MKNSSKLSLYLIAMLAGFFFTSCNRDGEVISEDEAADVIEYALSADAAGFSSQAEESAKMAETYLADCGLTGDSTLTFSSNTGALIDYDYSFTWNWELHCNGLVPNQFDLDYTSTGTYNAARMSSDDQGTASFVLSNLTGQGDYTLNGNFERTGSQESKVRNKNSFTSDLTVTLTNVTVSKSTYEITGGTGTLTITGSSSDGTAFSFTGSVTFLGGQSATLVLNGQSFSVSL
ncbi:MAG: hypothetical protein H6581_00495 [Bacteroidia bacterium]|nr:hypothetical protein [Bacteroidia bacterium]